MRAETNAAGVAPLLTAAFDDLLKAAAALYAMGFVVIAVQTARLNVPVLEAVHFQNVIAGLPVWGALIVGIWVARRLRIAVALADMRWPDIAFVAFSLIAPLALMCVLYWVIRLDLTGWEWLLVYCGFLVLLIASYLIQSIELATGAVKSLVGVMGVSSFGLVAVIVYATVLYPIIPQTFGGGAPARVQVHLKSREGPFAAGLDGLLNGPVYLYYRTGEYLLVAKDLGPGQPLWQISSDEVGAVTWLDGRAR